ncbi:MAG: ubiquinol-cytochrome C chaperone family protein [Novosphingobium sp.]
MSLLARLFSARPDPADALIPLWRRTVQIAREPGWYAKGSVADTLAGRFDVLTLVLAAVLLRMEREPALVEPSVRLTERFVADMDGTLREQGIGDPALGKRMGQLVSALGGRLGALREAFAADEAALVEAVARNVTFADAGNPDRVAAELRQLAGQLAALPAEALLAGEIER